MKKPEVISGIAEHQVSWNAQDGVASSKRPRRPSGSPEAPPVARKKRAPTDAALKNSGFMSISEDTLEAQAAHLEARIRQLGQATEQLRNELETWARSSEGKR